MDESLCDLSFYMCGLTELQEIRNKFQANLREWFDIAHSLVAIASIGSLQVAEESSINDHPYSFHVPVQTTLGVSLASINQIKYSKILEIYIDHKLAITELVFGRIIQLWYDFLNQLTEYLLKRSLAGSDDYPKIQGLISEFKSSDVQKIIQQFDRISAIKKISKIENYLEQKIDNEYRERITTAITVRNLLEHNQGVIRDSDLSKMKSTSIKLINESCQEQDFLIGEKVEITIYEVFRLKQAFYHASKQLIPN